MVGPADGVPAELAITRVVNMRPVLDGFLGRGSGPGPGGEGVAPVSTRVLVLSSSVASKMGSGCKLTGGPTAVCPDAGNYLDHLGDDIVAPTRDGVGTESIVEKNE